MGLELLNNEILACKTCERFLPNMPNPIVALGAKSKIIIIGQAPGNVVHNKGVPFDDKSGDTLREWLGVSRDEFYNKELFSIMPMGFCFPGKAKSGGDAAPRKECAPQWHDRILENLPNHRLKILIGAYAINYYLKDSKKRNLTETVRSYEEYYTKDFPLVHPSPLNFRWHSKNPWFKENVVPVLKLKVREILKEK